MANAAPESAALNAAFIGVREGRVTVTPMDDLPRLMEMENERPQDQRWRALAPIARLLAQPGPNAHSNAFRDGESLHNF